MLENDGWMKLLNDDGKLFSLKPWEEVTAAKGNKINIGLALRTVMRQAWCKDIQILFTITFLSNL